MHLSLMNGHPKCTLIESFSGEVSIVRPGFKMVFEKGLKEAQGFIEEKGWEISIFIIKGSPIVRNIEKGVR